MTALRARRALRIAVLAAVVLVSQLTATSASAAPTELPDECDLDFTPLTCNTNTIIRDVFPGGVLEGEAGVSPDPIGLVGLETWFAFLGINGDTGELNGTISFCQNSLFGIILPSYTPPYVVAGSCPASPPPGTPGTTGCGALFQPPCANSVTSLLGPITASVYFFLGILPAGYDVDFGSPDEAGNQVHSTATWPSFETHEYEQKGMHTIDYRVYWRPWIVGILVVNGFPLPFAFGASQISHTSLGQYDATGPDKVPGGTYQVDESRGTLEG